ncbi:MAG: hypothetical protein H3C62_01290 [Gemmatimonadaceae bacterium]|nr:hypothetical protein [Gemmatimonadaceae bacterium]
MRARFRRGSLVETVARARRVPGLLAWTLVAFVLVFSAIQVTRHRVSAKPLGVLVTGRVLVTSVATFSVDGQSFRLRGVRQAARGSPAGECAATALQHVLAAGALRVLPVRRVAGDTLEVFAVVADTLPVNALLLWRGAATLGALPAPAHALDRALILAAHTTVAYPQCPRGS